MEKLWLSHFGEGYREVVTEEFVRDIYRRIVAV
jgi:hypothetical protein